MKIDNLDGVLRDHAGKLFTDKSTVRQVLSIASTAAIGDPNFREEGAVKYKLGVMALKIHSARRHVFLSSDEIEALKPRVALLFAPIVVTRIFDVLEGKAPAEARIKDDIDQDGDAAEKPAPEKTKAKRKATK